MLGPDDNGTDVSRPETNQPLHRCCSVVQESLSLGQPFNPSNRVTHSKQIDLSNHIHPTILMRGGSNDATGHVRRRRKEGRDNEGRTWPLAKTEEILLSRSSINTREPFNVVEYASRMRDVKRSKQRAKTTREGKVVLIKGGARWQSIKQPRSFAVTYTAPSVLPAPQRWTDSESAPLWSRPGAAGCGRNRPHRRSNPS